MTQRSHRTLATLKSPKPVAVDGALGALVSLLVSRGARRVWLFRVQGDVLLAAPCSVDLVRVEEAPPKLAERIRAHGRRLHG